MFNTDTMTKREIEIAEYYKKKGAEHSSASPETKQKLKEFQSYCDSNRGNCAERFQKPMADDIKQIKETVQKIEIYLAGLDSKLENKFDGRYPSIESVKTLKDEVSEIKKKNYDWIKYAVITLISVIVTIFLSKVK